MANVDRLFAEAMKLSDEDRAKLADRLLEVVRPGDGIEKAWLAEAERRFAEHDAGRMKSSPWEEARQRIFAK